MSSMVVLYLRTLGQPLGALSTTVPGDLPDLGEAATVRMALPIPNPGTSSPSYPRPVTVARNDLAIANLDAEFDDPMDVFEWRVITTQGPDGKERRNLDRLGTGLVTVTRSTSGRDLELNVPKLGNQSQLNFEVRNEAGVKRTGVIIFGSNETKKKVPVSVPDKSAYLIFVEGYSPTVAPAIPGP
jgi:hypothetical protein